MTPSKTLKVTQSLMKAMRDYLEGKGCGLVLREQYINGRLFGTASSAMKLGIYFEYILTGALPKNINSQVIADALINGTDGSPQAEYMASKIKANGGTTKGLGIADMYEPYRMAHENKDAVLADLKAIGLKIALDNEGKALVGRTLTKGKFEGTVDVIMEAERKIVFQSGLKIKKGQRIVVDVKYSGLLEDKWSVHGWQWTPLQKRYHGTQAKQYHYITDLEPFFLVVDPGGKYRKLFHCVVDEEAITSHIEEGSMLLEKLLYLDELDLLDARPELSRCNDCPLKGECKFKHTFPHAEEVDLTSANNFKIEV